MPIHLAFVMGDFRLVIPWLDGLSGRIVGNFVLGAAMISAFFDNEASFDKLLRPYRERADCIMVGMNVFLLLICFAIAPIRETYFDVVLIGVPTLLLSYAFMRYHPGELITRVYMGCAFMAYTGLIIHQTGGDIEGHFSAFGLIGVLLYYRDWRVILAATVFIYLHHLVLGYAQTMGLPIYVFDDNRFWLLFAVHVAYFLPFIAMMMFLAIWLRREGYESRRVINLAQHIVQGNLLGGDEIEKTDIEKPLIHSVISMKNRLLDLLRVMPVPAVVVRVEDAKVVNVNEAWISTLGQIEHNEYGFNQAHIWTEEEAWNVLLEHLQEQSDNLLDKIEKPLRTISGQTILCELSLILHKDVEPAMAIMTVEDVTERRQAHQTMQKLAYNDFLTGLPNRLHMQENINEAFRIWNNEGVSFAVAVFDLDGFKPVNDTYGHDAGDEVLKAVASRFSGVKRDIDLIARLGGDEFVLIIRNCSELEIACQVAERFIHSLEAPIHIRGTDEKVAIGTSSGVTLVDENDMGVEVILKRADNALYQAKKAGKNRAKGI